ncbi:hypothetical protein ACFL1H_02975 [Nanoarchaeota archaeon]
MPRLTRIGKKYPIVNKKPPSPDKSTLDIVVAFDITASMDPYINDVKDKIKYFTEGILNKLDTNIMFAGVGEHDTRGWPLLQITKFHNDLPTLKRCISEMFVYPGGNRDFPEAYECLFKELATYEYKNPTLMVMIGDSIPHGMERRGSGSLFGDYGCEDNVDYKVELPKLNNKLEAFYFVTCSDDYDMKRYQRKLVEQDKYFIELSRFNLVTELIMGVAMDLTGNFDSFYKDLKEEQGGDVADEVLRMIRR